MKVTCPSCGVKNNIPDSPDTKQVYRCGKCQSKLFGPESEKKQKLEQQEQKIDTPKLAESPVSKAPQTSYESSLIDLWLTSDDIALIVSCLDWIVEDVESTTKDFYKLDARISKILSNKMPSDAYNKIIPMIKSVEKNILIHSIGYFEAMHDSPGREYLQQKLKELDQATTDIQRFKEVVSIGTSVSNMAYQK